GSDVCSSDLWNKPSSNSCREKPTKLRSSSMTRSPSVRYCHILTFSENRLLVPAFSSTADGQRGTPRRPSADGVTRLPSPLPYVFHLQGIAPKLLTHSRPTVCLRRDGWRGKIAARTRIYVRIGRIARGSIRRPIVPERAGDTVPAVKVVEMQSKSLLNRVHGSYLPFRWSVNPYRGCVHACVYCYARRYHEYLDMDPGAGFERQVFVKVNAVAVLRRELARPGWRRENVAIGTAVDAYQPVEGKYRLTRGILE